MLRMTVEIVPGGDYGRAREIAEVEVWNVSDLEDVSDYRWEAKLEAQPVIQGEVIGHRRASGWGPLIATVARQIGTEMARRPAVMPSEEQKP